MEPYLDDMQAKNTKCYKFEECFMMKMSSILKVLFQHDKRLNPITQYMLKDQGLNVVEKMSKTCRIN